MTTVNTHTQKQEVSKSKKERKKDRKKKERKTERKKKERKKEEEEETAVTTSAPPPSPTGNKATTNHPRMINVYVKKNYKTGVLPDTVDHSQSSWDEVTKVTQIESEAYE